MAEVPKTLISGASGLIGSALTRELTGQGTAVFRLARDSTPSDAQAIRWNPQAEDPVSGQGQLEGFDAVIHLAGANVGHRWTRAYKREIVESRVQTTLALVRLLGQLQRPPEVFLCASATGIYGDRGDEILTENSHPGAGFLAETCIAWESAAQVASKAGIRVVHLRFGVVLAAEGGALARMLPIFRLGLGGRLGSGRQWMSWISLPDLVSATSHIIHNPKIAGPVNLTAPEPVRNSEFTRILAQTIHRPAIFPAPAFALRLALGEMADEALIAGARVLPERLTGSGFQFQHRQLAKALQSLLR
jgi:uncharacterized protein